MSKKKNLSSINKTKFSAQEVSSEKKLIKVRVLIVCEGEQTEPNYFKSFDSIESSGGLVFDITSDGGKINTIQVVNKAIELREKAKNNGQPYDSVWAVFDRDSFKPTDFDNAISKARSKGIGCAWSNEAFELWYVLHFDNRITAMSRDDYKSIITQRVNNSCKSPQRKKDYEYKKNDERMRVILQNCGNEQLALKYAERLHKDAKGKAPHDANPCTTVYKLVRLLLGEDKKFNESIKQKVEAKI